MDRQDFLEAFRIQGRVLLALMLREARTRYGRRQAGYLWALIEPILHMTAFYFLFKLMGRAVPLGGNLFIFLATGLFPYLGFRNVLTRTEGGYGSNEALLSFPVVKIFDVFLGRALLELATWIAVTVLLLGGLIAVGYGSFPRSILTMMSALFALFCVAFGVGTILGIVSAFVPSVNAFLKLPTRALYLLSGIFYLPDETAPGFRDVIDWNPIMHGLTLFRVGYYRNYESYMLDPSYLWTWAIGSILMAFLVERAARKPLRSIS